MQSSATLAWYVKQHFKESPKYFGIKTNLNSNRYVNYLQWKIIIINANRSKDIESFPIVSSLNDNNEQKLIWSDKFQWNFRFHMKNRKFLALMSHAKLSFQLL